MGNNQSVAKQIKESEKKTKKKSPINNFKIPTISVTNISTESRGDCKIISDGEINDNLLYTMNIRFKYLCDEDIKNLIDISNSYGKSSYQLNMIFMDILYNITLKEEEDKNKYFERKWLKWMKVLSDLDTRDSEDLNLFDEFFPKDTHISYIDLKSPQEMIRFKKEVEFDVKLFKM